MAFEFDIKALEEKVNSMTDSELAQSFKKAGIEVYKNIKMKVFSLNEEPCYKDLWLDLYEYLLSQGRGADHFRGIMEEMDPSLLEEDEPQQYVRLGDKCCDGYKNSGGDASLSEYYVNFDRKGVQVGKAHCAACGKETSEIFD